LAPIHENEVKVLQPMATTRVLDIIVKAKDEASRVLGGIGSSLDLMRGKLNSVVSAVFSLRGLLAAGFAGIGVGMLAKEFIAAATEVEGYRVRLRILTGDLEKGNQLFKEAADYASKVSFEYREIMGSVTQLRAVVKGGNDEVIKWLKLTGDVAAASGLGIQTATEQIVRMYSAGAASADLFRERGVLAMLGFQAGVSTTAEATRKKLLEMWEKADSPIRNAAADLANTWSGLMSMIADKWFATKTAIMDEGLFNYLKAWLKFYVNFLDNNITNDKLSEWGKSTGEVIIKVIEKIAKAAGYLGTAFQGWGIIIGGAGRVLAWFMDLAADGADAIGYLMRKVFDFLEGFANMQREVAAFMPEFLGKTMEENAIRIAGQLKQWRIELAEGDTQIQSWRNSAAELRKDSLAILDNFIDQIPAHERIKGILLEVRGIAAEFSKETARASAGIGGDDKKVAKRGEVLKAAFARLKADLDFEQALLQLQYDQKIIDLNAYYNERARLIELRAKQEIELQRKLLATEEGQQDPNRAVQVKARIYELEKKMLTDLMKIEQERTEKIKAQGESQREVSRIIQSIKDRAADFGRTDLAATFNKELRELDIRQQEEIERLKKLNADKAEINDAYRAQELEKETLLADQRRRLDELYVKTALDSTKNLEQAFGDMYEVTGKKIKEFFYLQKAASIASTIISTYQSAQEAYRSLVGIPVVGPALATVAAATAVAAGMARVAVIASQKMAEGGEVKGQSPHSKADNIAARLTAGEYVHPVSAVQFYGKDVMEGLRKRMIPREIFAGLVLPKISQARSQIGYAVGGVVGATKDASATAAKAGSIKLDVINFVDPEQFGQYLATASGKSQIVNIISENAYALRDIILNG